MTLKPKSAALIVAAGRGERAGEGRAKQYRQLAGSPVLSWSVRAFADAGASSILIAHPPGDEALARAAAGAFPVNFIEGGATRTETVRRGLEWLAAHVRPDTVYIHDSARPGLRRKDIFALQTALTQAQGAAPALAPTDALKLVDPAGIVLAAAPRDGVMRVQTPQAFQFEPLHRAYQALPEGAVLDDDLAVAGGAGLQSRLVPGGAHLMKLTFPEDFATLEAIMNTAGFYAAGSGFDAHRFAPGAQVTLCGITIPHERGLLGHSDADAAWHALTDAILGALCLGDIGDHFPPSEARWKGAPSEVFLAHAAALATKAGARVMHVDVTIICEQPRIAPHREAMRARTGQVLGLPLDRVSIKATTTEKLGFLGRSEGLAAQASATLWRPA